MMQNTFYWEAARYISVAIIPGAGARYFTYANESDARRHETSMREWHGSYCGALAQTKCHRRVEKTGYMPDMGVDTHE